MLRVAAWITIVVLLAAAAFELALALGAGSFGPRPGDDVPGAEAVFTVAAVAMVVAAILAAGFARRPSRIAALLAPSAAAFMLAHFFTYDPYFAPELRRYSDGGAVSPAWAAFVAVLAAGAGVLTYLRPRAGGAVSCLVVLLVFVTTLFTGGH